MVTSEIYTKQLCPEHAQAVSRNSGRIMFACMCRCADASVRQKKEKGRWGWVGGRWRGERGERPKERKEGEWGGERQRIFGDI